MSNSTDTMAVAVLLLAEVRHLGDCEITDSGNLEWRGMSLSIQNLDAVFGMPNPAAEKLRSVVVIKALADTGQPFLVWAFCGTASYGRVSEEYLEAAEVESLPGIALATHWREEDYLIPDLEAVYAAA